MKTPAKAAVGDRVMVSMLVPGPRWGWLLAEVMEVFWWSHSSGNEYPAFKVRFQDGDEMTCGNNSIRVGLRR
jgi:hypothetical protein